MTLLARGKFHLTMRNLSRLLLNHADAWGVAAMISAAAVWLHDAWSTQALLLIVSVAAATWLGFAFNDYADAEHDALDPRKRERNFFVAVRVPHKTIIRVVVLIGVLAFALAYAIFGGRGVIALLIGGFAAWAYSAPPFRLKNRPFFDLITHAAFVQTFPYTVALFLLELPITPLDRVLLALFILASLGAQLEQQARDYATDKLTDRNFTTVFGLNTTTLLLRGFTAALMALSLLIALSGLVPAVLIPFGAIMLPITAHRFFRRADQPRSERLIRVGLMLALVYTAIWLSVTLLS